MSNELNATSKPINHSMRILSGIAIILVVMGHADFDALTLGGLFPYYSYHVMVFVFISGYFYEPKHENHVGRYIIRKAKHLLLPYFICNVLFAVLSTIMECAGFAYVNKFSLYNFFVGPFIGGHQYGLNFAAWFVPALFLIEVINICLRKMLSLFKCNRECLICTATFILGIATVELAIQGHVWGLYKTPGRILFMIPIFEFGRFYRVYLENKIKQINIWLWIGIIVAVQLILYMVADGGLNFSAVWCTGFTSLPIMPYLTTLTGTFLMLRIAEELESTKIGEGIEAAGKESFWIMMFHPTVFFIFNIISLGICNVCEKGASFDLEMFHSDVNYIYLAGGIYQWKLIYIIGGIVIPIVVHKAYLRIRHH